MWRKKGNIFGALFDFSIILYKNLPSVQPVPFALCSVPLGETVPMAFPSACADPFAHKRALPQWKSIKENSCGHDFPSCDSHWLNYFKKIADKISNSVCFFPYSVLQSTAYLIDRCSAGSGIIKTGSLCTRLRGNWEFRPITWFG